MNTLLDTGTFWFNWAAFFGIILARYFLIAGGTYALVYFVLGQLIAPRIQARRRSPWPSIWWDIRLSATSAIIFALSAALIMVAYQAGVTRIYSALDQYGLWYLGVSFGLVLVIQDAYFYFVHRLLHHPRLFRWLHQGHHRSKHPTPWTSFAFDPLEAVIQAVFFVAIVFVVPLHFFTLLAALMTMTVWAVFSHLGFPVFAAASRWWQVPWLIGPAHHSLHHRRYSVHFGLYFTFWDQILGTQDPGYDRRRQ